MEVVIRTAHGGADVDLAAFDDDTTLRDMLAAVTGLAVPTVVDIDGRPCRVDDRIIHAITDAGLRIGSVIDVASDRSGADPVTNLPAGDEAPEPLVELRQLSGRGAGEIVPLPAGSYRFGAGRRLVERELAMAVVEEEAFTVTVEPPSASVGPPGGAPETSDPRPVVTVRPGANVSGELGSFTPTLGGQLFDRPLRWTDDRLSVGGRVFELVMPDTDEAEADEVAIGAARIGRSDRAGVRSFDAAGTVAAGRHDAPGEAAVGALARLSDPIHTLWRRRPHEDNLTVPVGLSADHREIIDIDLDRHGGVAVSGTTDFTAGVARTVLVELATMLGPGDLDIVIVASAGRLGRWDWCKWLPHVRGGDPTASPVFLTTDAEVELWRDASIDESAAGEGQDGHLLRRAGWAAPDIDAVAESSPTGAPVGALPPPTGRPHARPNSDVTPRRTLLVVDDAAHWMRRESPLRSLLVDPHASIRVLAMTERLADAPATCTALIDELRPDDLLEDDRADGATATVAATRLFGSLCRLVERLGANPIVTTDVRPALTQLTTAARVALDLASYDDLRVRRSDIETGADLRSDRPTIDDLLAEARLDTPAPDDPTPPGGVLVGADLASMAVPIGRAADDEELATVDLARAGITAIAVDEPDDRQLLAAITSGIAARHEPDAVAILVVGEEPRWLMPLPHVIGTVDGDDTEQVGRVLRRVAATLTRDRDFQLLVIVDDAISTDGPPRLSDATVAFMELANSLERVHLVVSAATEHADMVRRHLGTSCGAFVQGRRDGTASLARHDDGIAVGTARIMPTVEIVLPVPHTPPPPAPSAGLRVQPFVFGRPLSPIERRLARRNDQLHEHSTDDPSDVGAGHEIGGDTSAIDPTPPTNNQLLPPPFPDQVGQETLFVPDDQRTQGMLPIGIIDRADGPGIDVLRWAPQAGSLISVGHRRSGMGTAVELVAAALPGIDADIWVLDPLPQRRRAFRRLPHCKKTADPDSASSVERFFDELEHRLAGRPLDPPTPTDIRIDLDGAKPAEDLATAVRGGPRPIIVVIADLNRTLACFPDDEEPAVIDRIARLAGSAAPRPTTDHPAISLVVSASRRHEVEPLLGLAAEVLVGDVDDLDRRAFGLPDRSIRSGSRDAIAGRGWSITRHRLVQLATPPERLEQYVRRRSGDLVDDASTPGWST